MRKTWLWYKKSRFDIDKKYLWLTLLIVFAVILSGNWASGDLANALEFWRMFINYDR